jgi:hypothetical protein
MGVGGPFMPFVKLDCGILDSSLWAEDSDTCKVFLTMLAMCEPEGLCRATAPGISHRARLSLSVVKKALAVLESPDSESRSEEEDGRRIERVDGGYHIVNYLKYRAKSSLEERREQVREAVARHRAKVGNHGVINGNQVKAKDSTLISSSSESSGEKGCGEKGEEAKRIEDEFETWWKSYPGTSPEKGSKDRALEKWKLTLRDGVTVETLTACSKNYSEAQGIMDFRRVMNASRFLGPGKEWKSYEPGTYQKPEARATNGKPKVLESEPCYFREFTEEELHG